MEYLIVTVVCHMMKYFASDMVSYLVGYIMVYVVVKRVVVKKVSRHVIKDILHAMFATVFNIGFKEAFVAGVIENIFIAQSGPVIAPIFNIEHGHIFIISLFGPIIRDIGNDSFVAVFGVNNYPCYIAKQIIMKLTSYIII
eukprot:300099_1